MCIYDAAFVYLNACQNMVLTRYGALKQSVERLVLQVYLNDAYASLADLTGQTTPLLSPPPTEWYAFTCMGLEVGEIATCYSCYHSRPEQQICDILLISLSETQDSGRIRIKITPRNQQDRDYRFEVFYQAPSDIGRTLLTNGEHVIVHDSRIFVDERVNHVRCQSTEYKISLH